MDRHTGEPSGESQQGIERDSPPDRGVAQAHLAHTAFEGARNTPVVDGRDFFAKPEHGQLTPAEIAALPDGWTVEVGTEVVYANDFLRVPGMPRHQPPESARPPQRQTEVYEEHLNWGDLNDIATEAGVELAIVEAFLRRNRIKLGNQFKQSRLQRRVVNGQETDLTTEHFSPEFMAWAIASLKSAVARYNKERAFRPEL